jgi:ribosomal protein S18 acetylase RimI-like enzyme
VSELLAEVRIRRARVEDAGPLAALAARLFWETYRDDVPPAVMEAFVAECITVDLERARLLDADVVTLLVERRPGAGPPPSASGGAAAASDGAPRSASRRAGDDRRAELVGYAQIVRRPLPVARSGVRADVDLARIYLDRRWQGRGLGRRLLGEVALIARGLGGTAMWLCVWERNAPAVAFYERLGFRAVGAVPFPIGGETHRDVVMMADLATLVPAP